MVVGSELVSLLRSWARLSAWCSHSLRPLQSAQSTCAPVSPLSAATAWRGQPGAVGAFS
jgi:hypothetical protein